MNRYKLRFHHVMCMHTYSGTGYSKEFSLRMEQLISDCQNHPETILDLTGCCDDLCAVCPHRRESLCKDAASIAQRDQEVQGYFCLKKGTLTYRELLRQIGGRFSAIERASQVCHSCQFYRLCDSVLPKQLELSVLLQPPAD